jgi:hypothetical protein
MCVRARARVCVSLYIEVYQEESAILQDYISWVKLYQFNQTHLYLKFNSYRDDEMF